MNRPGNYTKPLQMCNILKEYNGTHGKDTENLLSANENTMLCREMRLPGCSNLGDCL